MKILNIFMKNLRIVSRNPSYFIVLFVCPMVLILVAGAMLNSGDFNNIHIGIVDEDNSYSFNMQNLKNPHYYNSLTDCITSLTSFEVSACLYAYENNGTHFIDVYIDNTEEIIGFYTKNFILENVLSEQASSFEQTSEEIQAKLSLYSTSIANSKIELRQVLSELDEQERMLVEYRRNLTEIRRDFDEVYFSLKNAEPELKRLRSDLNKSNTALQGNITEFRIRKQTINNQISLLKIFLFSRLNSSDYNYVSSSLDSISSNLDNIDANLRNIENAQANTRNIIEALDKIDKIMADLERIKQTLDQMDRDLATSIQKTQRSKQRVNSFIEKLNEAEREMNRVSGKLKSSGNMALSFKDAFELPDNPVYIAFPLLVAIVITFSSLVLSNMFILKQINEPSYMRSMITPTRDVSFLTADYLINLFFIAVQATALFSIGYYWFDVPIDYLFLFTLIIFLSSSFFILVGISIGYLIKNQSLSMLLTIFLVMILLILSDLIVPAVMTSVIIKFFINMNPFYVLNRLLIDVLILGKGIDSIMNSLLKLGFLTIFAGIVAYISRKINKEEAVD